MFIRKTITFVTAILFLFIAAAPVQAQPLSDQVPDDALIYVGWRGANDLGPAYGPSHLKAVLESSNIPAVFSQFLPRLMTTLPGQAGREAQAMEPLAALSWAIWKYPTAIYFGGLDVAEGGPPMPRAMIMFKAGADAQNLVETIRFYIGEEGQSPFKLTSNGGLVTLAIGKIPAVGKTIAGQAKFTAAMKQVGEAPVFVAYADVEGVLANVDAGMAKAANEKNRKQFAAMREVLGLNGLKRFILTAGFEGRDWATRAYAEVPQGSRTGLMALLDGQPLSDDALKLVPKSAAWMTAMRFDVGKFVNQLRGTMKKFDPRAAEQLDEGIAQINEALGIDLQKDLFDALGDEWLMYTDNQIAGTGMLGMVAINRARDGKKLAATLSKLQRHVDALLAESLPGRQDEFQFDDDGNLIEPPAPRPGARRSEMHLVRTHEVDGLTLNYLSVPAVAPTWAIDGDVLYMAVYPQAVVSAAAWKKSGGESILTNAAFMQLHKRLNNSAKVTSVSYADLPQTAGEGYQVSLLISQLLMGAGDVMGVRSPPLVLPPLHKLRMHMLPAVSVTWTDATGWHMASITPFPGAEILGTQHQVLIATQAMTAGIMLPALGSARRTARQMQSSTQARGIHQGAVLWAQGARGKFPPDVATLLEASFMTPEYLISPMDSKKVPPDLMTWEKEKRAKWVNENTSYCYVTGLTDDNDSTKIAVFERLHTPGMQRVAVCFNDNHVEVLEVSEASELIKKQTGRTLQQWSEAKNPGAGGK